MNQPPRPEFPLPELEGALPPRPGDLLRLHRLCLYIYGLLTRDIGDQARALAEAVGSALRKKQRQELALTLEDELPVLIALHVLERLSASDRLQDQGLDELVRGLLLPCFALSYQQLYEKPADPLEYVLARVDWYLDGDKETPLSALAHFVATAWGDRLSDPGPLLDHLENQLLPEMDRRLDLAFRYEFA